MAAELDITNQRFNHFVALRKGPAKSGKWWFRCDCGTEGLRCKSSVVKGNARSCGCQRARQITKKTKQEICSLYSKGELSFAQIEKTYGINHRRIPEILEAGGVQRLDREDAMRRAFKTIQIGDKFGNLTVVTDLGYKKGSNWWKCECVCGKTVDLDTKTLNYRKETNLSCGCQRAEGIRHKLEGQVFGLLTLTEYQGKGKWKAICECGNTVVSSTRDIKNGHTQSCGCIGIGEDSISGWLNETFRFPERDGFFYVFEMANHPHLSKPGIATCLENRVAVSDGQYGELHDFIELPRIEAWLIEQAVLWETRHDHHCPEALEKWHGKTELRRSSPDALFASACRFHSQLQEVGRAEFAIRFLPTTPSQRRRLEEMK